MWILGGRFLPAPVTIRGTNIEVVEGYRYTLTVSWIGTLKLNVEKGGGLCSFLGNKGSLGSVLGNNGSLCGVLQNQGGLVRRPTRKRYMLRLTRKG